MERIRLKGNSTGQGLILTTLAMLALGVVMVHSAVASVAEPGPWYQRLDIRHTFFAAAAALALCTSWMVDYRWLLRGPGGIPVIPALLVAIGLACGALVFLPGVGYSVGGYHRWIRLGPREFHIGFQPSEIIKLGLVVFLAAWLTRRGEKVRSFWRTFLPAMAMTGLCLAPIITEDFGTSVLLLLAAGTTMLLAGVPWYYLISLLPVGALGFWRFVMLSDHRRLRIDAMINPWCTTNPSAYQPRQSLLAVISGQWFGKGLGGGTHKLGFLPEDSTDFIFSVYCEEWGFAGSVLLLGLLVMWMWHARKAAVRAGDRFGSALAGAVGFLIAVQAVLHVAVDLVAAPPTGMTMPFISSGGTALVMMAAAVGLMVSVSAYRDEAPEATLRAAAAAQG